MLVKWQDFALVTKTWRPLTGQSGLAHGPSAHNRHVLSENRRTLFHRRGELIDRINIFPTE